MTESAATKKYNDQRAAFMSALESAGYKNISDESGVIIANVSGSEYEAAKKNVAKIAKESGYELSFGIKKRQGA